MLLMLPGVFIFHLSNFCNIVIFAHDCFGHIVGQQHDAIIVHSKDLHTWLVCVRAYVLHPKCVRYLLILFFSLALLSDLSYLNCHLGLFFCRLVIVDKRVEMLSFIIR